MNFNKITYEQNEKEYRASAQIATDPKSRADYELLANLDQQEVKELIVEIERSGLEIKQTERAITDAEAKLQECLKNNPTS